MESTIMGYKIHILTLGLPAGNVGVPLACLKGVIGVCVS